jgi:hypothetical protein
MKEIFYVICFIIAITFVGLIGRIVFFPVNTAERLIDTAHQSQSKTLNADNAIYNYEYFKKQKEDIDAVNQKLFIARGAASSFKDEAGDRSKWTFEDKTEYSRLNSVSQGIESQLKDMIADYNAKSNMANRAIFKDSIVPNYIDALTFIKK